jgi:hypothetical protein
MDGWKLEPYITILTNLTAICSPFLEVLPFVDEFDGERRIHVPKEGLGLEETEDEKRLKKR